MSAVYLMRRIAVASVIALMGSPALAAGPDDVKHLIIIYGENRSFDNLYGLFPGADGLANADNTRTQVDKTGKPYKALPQPIDTRCPYRELRLGWHEQRDQLG